MEPNRITFLVQLHWEYWRQDGTPEEQARGVEHMLNEMDLCAEVKGVWVDRYDSDWENV